MLSVDWEFTEQDQLYVGCCLMPGGRELQSELYKYCTSMPRGWLLEGALLHSLPGSPRARAELAAEEALIQPWGSNAVASNNSLAGHG